MTEEDTIESLRAEVERWKESCILHFDEARKNRADSSRWFALYLDQKETILFLLRRLREANEKLEHAKQIDTSSPSCPKKDGS